jgi:hypothetical protein
VSGTSLSKQQLAKLRAKIGEVGYDEGRFLEYLAARWRNERIKCLRDIPARNFGEVMAGLEAKLRVNRLRANRRDPSKPLDPLDEMLERFRDDSSELGLFWRSALERVKAGDDPDKALPLALAEQLAKHVRREHWPRELLELAAELLLEECEPKLRREWERKHALELDRKGIDWLAKELKAQGCRDAKTEAEKRWAEVRGVTVHALRQRRYRPPGSRRRRSKV